MNALYKYLNLLAFITLLLAPTSSTASQCYDVLTSYKSMIQSFKRDEAFSSTSAGTEQPYFESNLNITDRSLRRKVLISLAEKGLISQTGFSSNFRVQCFGTCYAFAAFNVLENELIKNDYVEKGSIISTTSILTKVARMRAENGFDSYDMPTLISAGTDEVFKAIKGQTVHYFTPSEISKLKNAIDIGSYKNTSEYFLTLQELFFKYQSSLFNKISPEFRRLPFNQGLLGDKPIDNFINFVKAWTGISLNYKTTKPLYLTTKVHVLDKQETFIDNYIESIDNTSREQTNTFSYLKVQRIKSYKEYKEHIFLEFERVLNNDSYIWIGFDYRLFSENHAVTLTNTVYLQNGKLIGFIYQNSALAKDDVRNDAIGFITLRQIKEYSTQYSIISAISTESNR